MRIVGGQFRGREVAAPKGRATRPMSDRTRESIFNILGDIADFRILDAYAGSGAVGLEALSRGAAHVNAVEKNFPASRVISKNVAQLGLSEQYRLFREPVESWLKGNQNKFNSYDLIFFCPPHSLFNADLLNQAVPYLKPAGILIAEHFYKNSSPVLDGMEHIRTVSYDASAWSIYRRL